MKMTIDNHAKLSYISFRNLKECGDIFVNTANDSTYIRISGENCNSVNLENGKVEYIKPDQLVLPVMAKLTITLA